MKNASASANGTTVVATAHPRKPSFMSAGLQPVPLDLLNEKHVAGTGGGDFSPGVPEREIGCLLDHL